MDCPIIEHIRDVDRGHVGSAVYCFGGRVDELKGPLTARTGALYISVILTDATVNVDYERMQATIFGRDDKSLPRVQPGDYLFLTNVKFQLRDHGSIHCVSTAKTTYYGWDPSIPKKVTKNEKVLVTPQQLSILSKYFMKHCRELLAREHDRGVVTVRQQHSNAPGNTPSKQSNVPSNAPPKPSTEAPTSAQPRQEPAVVPTNVIVSTSNTYNGTFSKPRILLRDLTASMTTSVVVQVIRALTSGRTYVLQVSDFTSNEAFKACDAVEGMGLPCGKYSMEVAVYDGSKKYCLDNIECGAIITIDQLQLRMSPYGNLEARVNGDRMNPARSFIRVLAEDDPEALIVIARRAKCLERLRRNEYENGLTLPPEPKFGKDAQNGVHADSKAVEASPHQESTLSRSVGQYEPRQSLSPSRYSDPPTRTFDPADYRKASKLPSSQSDMNPPVKGEKRKNEEADENASKRLDAVSQPSTNTEINKPSRTSLNGKENATQAVKSPPAQPATKLSQNIYCSDRTMLTTPIKKIVSTAKAGDNFRLICSVRDVLPSTWDEIFIKTPTGEEVFGIAAVVVDEAGDSLVVAIYGSEAERLFGCQLNRENLPIIQEGLWKITTPPVEGAERVWIDLTIRTYSRPTHEKGEEKLGWAVYGCHRL